MNMNEKEEKEKEFYGIALDDLLTLRFIDIERFKRELVKVVNKAFPGDEEIRARTLKAVSRLDKKNIYE